MAGVRGNMQEAIVLEFPLREAEFETAGEASSQIKQALAQLGIPAHINRRIVTSVYEAAMNGDSCLSGRHPSKNFF